MPSSQSTYRTGSLPSSGRDIARTTCASHRGMLSVAFDRAVILGITERNPSRMVGNVRGQKPLVDFWTLDEFEKVISKLYKGDYYEHYLFISLLFLFMSGMRLGGEASALLWSDIDFTTGLCSITKTLYYHNQSDYKFTKPKTRAAIRSIYLDEDTLSELAAWRKVRRVVIPDCVRIELQRASDHKDKASACNEEARRPRRRSPRPGSRPPPLPRVTSHQHGRKPTAPQGTARA